MKRMKPMTKKEKKNMELKYLQDNFEKVIDEYKIDINSEDNQELLITLNKLERWKQYVIIIYAETQSLRKTAKLLNVSHSFINKIIKNIKTEFKNELYRDS